MTNWTARIDALPVLRDYNWYVASKKHDYDWDRAEALQARLALAAERLKEPHKHDCEVNQPVYTRQIDHLGNRAVVFGRCTCGKDADLLRIMEGK